MGDPVTKADLNVRTNVLLILQERGWSIVDFAKVTGIPTSRLQQLLEAQESMDLRDVWLMAGVLGVQVADLVYAGPTDSEDGV
ncbi:helix-turn-helix domain-containing protein [Actinomyces minihominis]|uniref:helix-turn-helix domain-containing protein n=1 Tax=Actinomyces minihominis TaxID=2002838 RepID=UPI000C073950|nr:helix-turn-helix transcriptional regulator [Actinomyces minihominis]